MATAEVRHCPRCGAPLRADAGEASCPACAMRGAFAEEDPNADCGVRSSESPGAAGASPSPGGEGWGEGPAEFPNPKSQISNATRRFGDYELLEEIARGGMGVVYKARQISLNRTVAVKMILASQFASKADVQRFRAEAEAAARLQHPNIVAIHEIGQHDGQHYFSMDFVEGQNLGELVRNRPLPSKQAAKYLKAIAEAINFAHEHGILHRDL